MVYHRNMQVHRKQFKPSSAKESACCSHPKGRLKTKGCVACYVVAAHCAAHKCQLVSSNTMSEVTILPWDQPGSGARRAGTSPARREMGSGGARLQPRYADCPRSRFTAGHFSLLPQPKPQKRGIRVVTPHIS